MTIKEEIELINKSAEQIRQAAKEIEKVFAELKELNASLDEPTTYPAKFKSSKEQEIYEDPEFPFKH